MITVHTMYDSEVFKDESTIQSEVEELELYLIAINPSTIEDQASIIPDRVADLHDRKEPILSTAGIPVQDVLRFFTGDHPAAQFERGTQVGGKYKCGGCGCKATIMDDQAHTLRCKTRSLKEPQTIALQGVLGKVPRSTKALLYMYLTCLYQTSAKNLVPEAGTAVGKEDHNYKMNFKVSYRGFREYHL